MEAEIRKSRALRTTLLALLALGLVAGCGGDGGESDGTTTEPVAVPKATIDVAKLRACLKRETGAVGTPGKDALLADYANEAVAGGGGTFVIADPLAQVIVFPDQVDLDEASSRLDEVIGRHGVRAVGLQGDAYGNVLIAYFTGTPAEKAPATECLGGEAVPVPGHALPYNYQGPGEAPQDNPPTVGL